MLFRRASTSKGTFVAYFYSCHGGATVAFACFSLVKEPYHERRGVFVSRIQCGNFSASGDMRVVSTDCYRRFNMTYEEHAFRLLTFIMLAQYESMHFVKVLVSHVVCSSV
jgi:hypothetical protein